MRPVRLDIDGFAAFRDPASVVFDQVDYFAFVGKTGSGKSTLIDAICFALYGTAPRWGRANAVSDALAPTANNAMVSLVFDIGDQRYQAVRTVTRGKNSVTTKEARLERFRDPQALPAPGEAVETEVLVSEVKALTPAVEELLGLQFSEFTQCVVLPQGEFAQFLKATSTERQSILLKLLGADSYGRMRSAAAARAKEAQHQATALRGQLELTDATPEALRAAEEDVTRLQHVDRAVRTLAGEHSELTSTLQQASAVVADSAAAHAVLADLASPEGLTARHEVAEQARAFEENARQAARAARTAWEAAVAAVDTSPSRASLERVVTDREHLGELTRRRAQTMADLTPAGSVLDARALAAQEAVASEQEARAEATALRERLAPAAQEAARVESEHQALSALAMPEGLQERASEARVLADRTEQAHLRATEAAAHATAVTARAEAVPDVVALDDMDARVALLARLDDEGRAAAGRLVSAQAGLGEAQELLGEAELTERAAGESWARARAQAGAQALRHDLSAGEDCPVCLQHVSDQVAAAWPPDAENAVDTAQRAVAQARTDLDRAREKSAAASAEVESTRAQHAELVHQRASTLDALRDRLGRMAAACSLTDPLPGDRTDDQPDAQVPVAAWQQRVDAVRASARQVAEEAASARGAAEEAQREMATLAAQTEASQVLERRDHDLLVSVHGRFPQAPDLDGPLTQKWTTLLAWAGERAHALQEGERAAARAAVAALHQQVEAAEAAVAAAHEQRRRAEEAHRASQSEHAALQATLTTTEQGIARAAESLREAPADEEIPALLVRADALAADVQRTVALREAGEADHERASAALAAAGQALAGDRASLVAWRDEAAVWGPPAFVNGELERDLPAAWHRMTTWAQERAASAAAKGAAAEHEAQAAQRRADEVVASVAEQALGVGVAAEADLRTTQESVAIALTRAEGRHEAIAKELAAAAGLVAQIAELTEKERVADALSSLLRADRFQQWLAGAALDTLVAGASESLLHLSDRRFSLTHLKGDFHVVDHFDADSTRSVKTLSGGETFQTSLALALALSEQLATLASGGTARLESIFLDEGFGTLDPESLETVASTLETLASDRRMVGVVTHVAALAERIPVQFHVTSDNRTSRVVRAGDGSADLELGEDD